MEQLKKIWAKKNPFQSILTHGEVSGLIAQYLLDNYTCKCTKTGLRNALSMSEEDLYSFVGYYVSLHDIGKIGELFQEGSHDKYNKIRHEKTSYEVIMRIWQDKYSVSRRITRVFAEIIQAHHQGRKGISEFSSDTWQLLQNQYESQMAKFFCWNGKSFPKKLIGEQGVFESILLGILILSDWIASGSIFSDAENWQKKAFRERVNKIADTFAKESGLKPVINTFGSGFNDIWPNINKESERELQRQTEKLFDNKEKQSLILIEAPMGEGKTEAAIYAAMRLADSWGKDGFYISLPTSATSNQMVERVRSFFRMHDRNDKVRLLHSNAWLGEEIETYNSEEEKYIYQWMLPGKRAMLSQFAVGTVDQAMMSSMCVRYGVLRLLGLTEKVLIIDEIHAYDMYMMNIITGLLAWCKALQIPVVLLSATLPRDKIKRLLSVYTNSDYSDYRYPSITAVNENGAIMNYPIKTVAKQMIYDLEIKDILNSEEDIAILALKKVSQGGCCCVLLNTVKQAQKVYEKIIVRNSDVEVQLFHSRFLAKDRSKIEKECIEKYGKTSGRRPKKGILVATQVVEQSLDVDFDYMISAIAPIDLLLQRMGRQYRHSDTPRPRSIQRPIFTVLTPAHDEYAADGYVYDKCVLKRSAQIISQYQMIHIPEDMEIMVNSCYDRNNVPANLKAEWDTYERDLEAKEALSDRYKLCNPEKKFFPLYADIIFSDQESNAYLSAKTRLSEPTTTVAILNSDKYLDLKRLSSDGTVSVLEKRKAKYIYENSVDINLRILNTLLSKHELETIKGKMLIEGVIIIEENNGIIMSDSRKGVIWKEV